MVNPAGNCVVALFGGIVAPPSPGFLRSSAFVPRSQTKVACTSHRATSFFSPFSPVFALPLSNLYFLLLLPTASLITWPHPLSPRCARSRAFSRRCPPRMVPASVSAAQSERLHSSNWIPSSCWTTSRQTIRTTTLLVFPATLTEASPLSPTCCSEYRASCFSAPLSNSRTLDLWLFASFLVVSSGSPRHSRTPRQCCTRSSASLLLLVW
jgi:hypothetical protein